MTCHPGFVARCCFALLSVAWIVDAKTAQGQCVDEQLRQQLVGRRASRGVVPRLFKKALRHEFSAVGGWFAADLGDGSPAYGGAYTFHVSEALGLEASYLRSTRHFGFLQAINDRQQNLTQITSVDAVPVQLFLGHLVWSLAYGKVRWFGGPIGRFDLYAAIGGGASDENGSSGVTGSVGFGMKMHLAQWSMFRVDVRDHIHPVRAPLGVSQIVHDLSVVAGFSLFLPLSS